MSSGRVPFDGNLTNPVVGSPNLYTGSIEWSSFDYKVSTAVCVFFTALFGISFILHVGQAIKSKRWFLLYTLAAAAVAEALGWGFRTWAAVGLVWSPLMGGVWTYPDPTFTGQIAVLIIAPAFSTAANYIILGLLVSLLGHRYCRLAPRTYTVVFVSGDIVSLVIQAVGGGMAASADTAKGADDGATIMVIGVITQMVVMVGYTLIFVEFCTRYLLDKPCKQWSPFAWIGNLRGRGASSGLSVPLSSSSSTSEMELKSGTAQARLSISAKDEKHAKILLGALAGSTTLIFIRSIFRTIELLDGWDGALATDQVLFSVLDGGMIALSSILLNVLHPIFLLRSQPPASSSEKGPASYQLRSTWRDGASA